MCVLSRAVNAEKGLRVPARETKGRTGGELRWWVVVVVVATKILKIIFHLVF